jgi:hypothetical protein
MDGISDAESAESDRISCDASPSPNHLRPPQVLERVGEGVPVKYLDYRLKLYRTAFRTSNNQDAPSTPEQPSPDGSPDSSEKL